MLGSQQRARLDAEGFVHLPALVSDWEVRELRCICDQIVKSGDGLVNLAAYVDIADVCPVARRPEVFRPELRQSPAWERLLSIGRSVLGAEATLGDTAFFIKPPRIGSETFWHQDEAFYDGAFDHRELKMWVALDDVDDSNSPLEYVPASHLLGVLPHKTIDAHGVCATLADIEQHCRTVVRMRARAGDVMMHRSYMLHHAPANRSERIRRALVVNMRLPPVRRLEPLHMPWKKHPHL